MEKMRENDPKTEQLRLDLTKAMFHNDVPKMKSFLKELFETKLDQQLEAEVSSANLLIDRLESQRQKTLEEKKNVVCKGDIVEVRSFPNPPRAVLEVISAVLVLLGYKEQQDMWRLGKKLLQDTTLVSKLCELDIDAVSEKAAQRAKDILSNSSVELCKNSSAAAASLYLWVENIANVVLNKNNQIQ